MERKVIFLPSESNVKRVNVFLFSKDLFEGIFTYQGKVSQLSNLNLLKIMA